MQGENWLKMMSLNRIKYSIKLNDGSLKEGFLRFSKSQSDRYTQLLKEKGEKDEPLMPDEILEITLNPEADKDVFTREQINEALDIDEQKLLSTVWMQKKIIEPKLSRELDPNFF